MHISSFVYCTDQTMPVKMNDQYEKED